MSLRTTIYGKNGGRTKSEASQRLDASVRCVVRMRLDEAGRARALVGEYGLAPVAKTLLLRLERAEMHGDSVQTCRRGRQQGVRTSDGGF